MGDSNETSKEMENLSIQNRSPRDLLERFMGVSSWRQNESNVDLGDIELNLGLSLGGRFGVDKLVRSSSVAGAIPLVRDEPEVLTPPAREPAPYLGLSRTCSLPVEMEEDWRKRKEMQSLRRMEAKRRRSEKLHRVSREEERRGGQRNKVGSSATPPSWTAAARQALIARGRGNSVGSSGHDSQGGYSEIIETFQGTTSCGDISPAIIQSAQSNQETVGSSGTKEGENADRPPRAELKKTDKRMNADRGMNSSEGMPCVFTKGDGPNGRRIQGILYKYGKGEEARIMCVCHGDFYSPAGFVKHAGGTDIAHALKHIVVNPSSS